MNQPELFDIVELLIDLPENSLKAGIQGTIVECFDKSHYEVEFANFEGETLALCTLSPHQFAIVWQASTKSWCSSTEKITAVAKNL